MYILEVPGYKSIHCFTTTNTFVFKKRRLRPKKMCLDYAVLIPGTVTYYIHQSNASY